MGSDCGWGQFRSTSPLVSLPTCHLLVPVTVTLHQTPAHFSKVNPHGYILCAAFRDPQSLTEPSSCQEPAGRDRQTHREAGRAVHSSEWQGGLAQQGWGRRRQLWFVAGKGEHIIQRDWGAEPEPPQSLLVAAAHRQTSQNRALQGARAF